MRQLENKTGIEGELDAETILGISYPTPLTIYSTGGLDPT
jgi:tripeptidyl-peptidase-1